MTDDLISRARDRLDLIRANRVAAGLGPELDEDESLLAELCAEVERLRQDADNRYEDERSRD